MSWTDERVEVLKKLWQDGLSASQIAGELGGVTRNAVIGKIHRLGMSGRGQPTSTIKRQRKPRTAPVRRVTRQTTVAIGNTALVMETEMDIALQPQMQAEIIVPTAKRLSIEALTERTCKWPIGDPTEEEFHFCGHDSLETGPYCGYHAGIAFQPADSRRRGRRTG